MDIILFGDQTVDCYQFLRRTLQRQRGPQLNYFFEQVSILLQEDISLLTKDQRRRIPSFLTISELVERYYGHQSPFPPLESALVCISQFAHFIGYFEETTPSYPNLLTTRLVGVCTGLLAANAVASSSSLTDLIPLALQIVRVAFKVGLEVATAAGQLEPESSAPETWSTVVIDIGEAEAKTALDIFNNDQGALYSNKLYISAVGVMSITISGPPSLRKRLFEISPVFRPLHRKDIPVWGPYHASHLYGTECFTQIIPSEAAAVIAKHETIFQVVHEADSAKLTNSASESIYSSIVEVLTGQIHWDKTLAKIGAEVCQSTHTSCRILAMGPSTLSNSLASSLKTSGLIISLEDHVSWLSDNAVPPPRREPLRNSKIAIVGMAGRFPDAPDHEALWSLLERGLDVHKKIPSNRFDADAHTDPSGKGKNMSHTPFGCFIEEPGLFDPRFFNMSPREAAQTDPMQRLALMTAYEAIEMSGFVLNRSPSTQANRVATFYGQTSDDWREINAAQDIDTYFITGGVRAFGPGRINYHFKFSGPSFNIDTACSSSMAAIQLACTSLRAGECDTVFAGGMNVMTNPDIFSGLSKGQFLSKTGSCKTYDDGADGYCRGDGVATLILKRLEDAITDKDPILGVICGTATNHSAEAVSITHPHVGAQQFLFQKVMDDAGVDVCDVGYVEMHGTGTQAGDGVEMESVSSVFAPASPLKRRRIDQPLFLGSVKSNIGHGEAASGVSALVKILLMLQKNMIPPHCGIKTKMNKGFPKDLRERNVHIAQKPTSFPRDSGGRGKRYVFLNNFSAAGGNTAMLLEDGPIANSLVPDPRSVGVITISAKSLGSFRKSIVRLQSWVAQNPTLDLSSLAYTTTARRSHYNYRAAIEASTIAELSLKLATLTSKSPLPISSTAPKVAFVFTGQGSQYSSMGKELYNTSPTFRQKIESLAATARSQGFPCFLGIINGSIEVTAATSPVTVQLSITCLQIALCQLWRSWGAVPSAVIGHSLGEYAALHCAGVLSTFDVISLVGRRAEALVNSCSVNTHGMLAVRGISQDVQASIQDMGVDIACLNGPDETVLCGTISKVCSAEKALSEQGFKCKILDVPFAFHSSQVDPILENFEKSAHSVVFHTPTVPIISPLLSKVIDTQGLVGPQYLARHCREKVDFLGGLQAAIDNNTIDEDTVWIEIGPHPVCLNMIKATLGSEITTVFSLKRNVDPWSTVSRGLSTLYEAGVALDWSEYHSGYEGSHNIVSLPSYPFDEKVYWLEYKNNWTLSKGESQTISEKKPSFSTTTIHRIVSEKVNGSSICVIAESNLSEPLLRAAISGHIVNGAGLCPSSIYADMALTLCDYAYRLAPSDIKTLNMNVQKMETFKPLILDMDAPTKCQNLQIEAKLDLTKGAAELIYRSVSEDKMTFSEHAKCSVTFESKDQWKTEWDRNEYLIKSRIELLKSKKGVNSFHRGMAYKLFAALVDYGDKYRGMESVVLDSDQLEGVSEVAFQATKEDGKFLLSPYFIDSVAHLSGFIMNANDAVDSKNQVYISHGWDSMRFAEPLVAEKKYRAYVKMQPMPGAGKMVAGDVYVFESDKIIGVVGGVKFQCVPRPLLNTLLKPRALSTGRTAQAQTPKSTAKPAVSLGHKKVQASVSSIRITEAVIPQKPIMVRTDIQRDTDISGRAMDIIAAEVGCHISELANPVRFADLGIDSLMSLAISGRFREDLELDIPSTLFNEISTIGELKTHLNELTGSSAANDVPSSAVSSSGGSEVPSLIEDTFDNEQDIQFPTPDSSDSELSSMVRSTIASQMGVHIEEISQNTDLTSLGMDSLMSLAILGELREKTGLELQSDFFNQNISIGAIEQVLGISKPQPRVRRGGSAQLVPFAEHKSSNIFAQPMLTIDLASFPASKSVLLQGNIRTATRNLFLLPDGSGSATSYVPIPDIDRSRVCVYGLNCPFMTTPERFDIGVPAVCQIYMAEIRRRQPRGPYLLGGWSAGGVLAYEMTRQLIALGEKVERLVLIDSPCPIGLQALPGSFHQFCDRIGLLGDGKGKTPSWLLPHFASSVRELTKFSDALGVRAEVDESKMPTTTLIWARDGLCKTDNDPRPDWDMKVRMPNSMQWLVENRTDLGPNGWEKLVGKRNVRCVNVDGNHFTMMREPIIGDIARLIRDAIL